LSSDSERMFEIQALYTRYADLIDEGPISQWPSLFVEQGLYKIVTRENLDRGWALALMSCDSRAAIEDRAYAIEHLAMTIPRRVRHLISGFSLEPKDAQAWAVSANFAVFETIEGRPTVCFAAGHYRDIVVREDDGVLRFREKISICDAASINNSLVFPL
jgi:3-phenylpropionate/cinnamic acid dioxygenase small subunit